MEKTLVFTDPGDAKSLGVPEKRAEEIITKAYDKLVELGEPLKRRDLAKAAVEIGDTANEVLLIHAFLCEQVFG